MRGVDDARMMQANSSVEDSQRFLLFSPQGESSAAINSITCSMEAELDPTICWRQAQLSQRGLDMAHIRAAQQPGMVSIARMSQNANGLEPSDRENNIAGSHIEA
jgi:hypothetical protein